MKKLKILTLLQNTLNECLKKQEKILLKQEKILLETADVSLRTTP
jgi:hypothetical protein